MTPPRRFDRIAAAVAGLSVSWALPAHAQGRPCAPPTDVPKQLALPSESTEGRWLLGPGVGVGLGLAGAAALACGPPSIARPALKDLVLAAGDELGADAEIALVFTTRPLACGNIYYVPLANDVRGIGYRHADARDVFDDTPGRRLEGVAFLNDWPYWQPRLEELHSALLHEVGHRWAARVHARVGDRVTAALLGREGNHWSYFLDSGGSPLEGNVWRATSSGQTSDTPRDPRRFSELDLYLMGLLPPGEVPPLELLVPAPTEARDCAGNDLAASSPPQTCAALELDAERITVPIDDVIAAEGPRLPAASDAPRSIGVLPLVLQSSAEPWTAAECEALALAVHEGLDAFERATQGRLSVQNVLAEGMRCEAIQRASSADDATEPVAPALPVARPSCTASRQTPRSGWHVAAWLVLACAWRRRGSRPAGPPRGR